MPRRMKPLVWTAEEYIAEYAGITRSQNGILVPITVAAAALGYEPTTVRAHVRKGHLREVIIDCSGIVVKGVSMSSLASVLEEREAEVSDLAEEIEPHLSASGGRTIEYGRLMSRVGLTSNNPHHRTMIAKALGRISEESFRNGDKGFMISALVVLKTTGRPSEPFFELAEWLGAKRHGSDNERFWQRQMAAIRDWAGPQSDEEET